MEWKEEKEDTRFSDGTKEKEYDEDEYPVWEKQKRFSFTEALLKKIEIPLILMAVGIVVLIALFLTSGSGKNPIEISRFESMEKKVQAVEERLAKMEGENAPREGDAESRKEIGQLQKKVSQIENAVALRMDQISTEVAGLKKQASAPPAQETAKPQKASPQETAKPQKAPQETPAPKDRFHEVRPGETLFSISRNYNISVDELRKMNNLPSNEIHPGDKLLVGRSAR